MRLCSLELINFKNHPSSKFNLQGKVVAFTGLNGSGKTNALDAIFYLCFTKSYFNSIEKNNVRHQTDFFRIKGIWEEDGDKIPIEVRYDLKKKKKKVLYDGSPYRKLSEHIGKIPVVMIAPDDQLLLLQLSEERRKLLDLTLSQIDVEYFNSLSQYNRILKQRNAILKEFSENQYFDASLISTYDQLMIESGEYIFRQRKKFSEIINEKLTKFYSEISNRAEECSINYESHLQTKPLAALFNESLEIDRFSGRTSKGVHKDDLELLLNNKSLKQYGSQGQQKSFLLSLKLAQLEILYEHNKKKPVIIIDDIFAKLDEKRVQSLLSVMKSDRIAQVFISDTNKNRLENVFQSFEEGIEIIELNYEQTQ